MLQFHKKKLLNFACIHHYKIDLTIFITDNDKHFSWRYFTDENFQTTFFTNYFSLLQEIIIIIIIVVIITNNLIQQQLFVAAMKRVAVKLVMFVYHFLKVSHGELQALMRTLCLPFISLSGFDNQCKNKWQEKWMRNSNNNSNIMTPFLYTAEFGVTKKNKYLVHGFSWRVIMWYKYKISYK